MLPLLFKIMIFLFPKIGIKENPEKSGSRKIGIGAVVPGTGTRAKNMSGTPENRDSPFGIALTSRDHLNRENEILHHY